MLIDQCFGELRVKKCWKSSDLKKVENFLGVARKLVFWRNESQKMLVV